MSSTSRQTLEKEYSSLFDYLYRYAAYRIPRREDAEDLVSDIFMTALARIDRHDEAQGNLRQWLTGIARHKVADHWRGRRQIVPIEEYLQLPAETSGDTIIGLVHHDLMVARVLRKCTPETRALLALKHEDGLTYEEIAELLGQKPAAVRQQFSRIHRKLRIESLDDYDTL